jgi:hypothetical protein
MSFKRILCVCSITATLAMFGGSAFAAPRTPQSSSASSAAVNTVQPYTAIKTNFDGFNLQVFGTGLHVDQIWVGFVGGLFNDEWCGNVAWSINGVVDEDSEFHICGTSDAPDWGYEDVNQDYADGTQICEVIVNPDSGYSGSLTSLPCATVHS